MAFKDRIKEARLNKKLTQEELAKRIGVAKSTLAGYEGGIREPNIDTTIKIMAALDIDANYLWQDEMNELGGISTDLTYDEIEHIKKYRSLDEHGKDGVDVVLDKEYDRYLKHKFKHQLHSGQPLYPMVAEDHSTYGINAAHDENPTEDQKINADNIMDDDNEWK